MPSGRRRIVSAGEVTAPSVLVATMVRHATTVGVATHMTQVVDLLRARGVDAEVVGPSWPGTTSSAALLGPTTMLRTVTRREGAVRLDRAVYQRILEQALRRRFRIAPPSVVYAQDPRSAAAALKVRGSAPVPVIMVVHYNESQAQELVERGTLTAGGRYEKRIREFEKSILPRLDGVIYVSRFMYEHLVGTLPEVADLPGVIVPNFLEDDQSSLPPSAQSRDCITVGSLVERKNHGYLLEVLAAARGQGHRPTLTVVGHGPLRPELQRRAKALGVADQVHFAGSRADVASLLRQHRVYVHSATSENLPYALIEAFRAGLPVVSGRVGGIGEMVESEENGRFWPLEDPVAGAQVLSSLLSDPQALDHLSRRARRAFEERYSVAAVGDALADFLLSCSDRRARPAALHPVPRIRSTDDKRDVGEQLQHRLS